MTTKTELRDELIEALERVYYAMNPSDSFDMAYEAIYVATHVLGSSIPDLNEGDEIPEADARIAELRAAFPSEVKAFEQVTARWAAGGPEGSSGRKDHKYAADLLDIIDTLK